MAHSAIEVTAKECLYAQDDALATIFTRLSTSDVVCCTTTCRRWCRVVAKEAAVLSRAPSHASPCHTRPPRALLGLFHQEEDLGVTITRKRKRSSSSTDDHGFMVIIVGDCASYPLKVGSFSLASLGRPPSVATLTPRCWRTPAPLPRTTAVWLPRSTKMGTRLGP
ncbi:hypothetical protein PR202_gb11420 [Eleusine coracana subsp. coracana]|uniref:F-box domain-containing protein n=1 Tax=Eleusine coracana subsp. coracana TaxID=191504 RepID=A0AAV5EML3_ELECO|nr:hypothetical protein PR202_gb11420 [Eleusine coracana subsp. coracana]